MPPAMASDSFVCRDALGSSVAVSVSLGLLAMIVACAARRGRSTRSRPRLMGTSRVDGVKAPLHNGTPRSRELLVIFHTVGAVDGRDPLDDRED